MHTRSTIFTTLRIVLAALFAFVVLAGPAAASASGQWIPGEKKEGIGAYFERTLCGFLWPCDGHASVAAAAVTVSPGRQVYAYNATTTALSPVYNIITNNPVIERIVQTSITAPNPTTNLGLDAKILQIILQMQQQIASLRSAPIASGVPSGVAPAQTPQAIPYFGLSQRIDRLTNTEITNPTITGGLITGVTLSATDITASGTGTFGTATTSALYGAGLTVCESGNVLTWNGGVFGCAADQVGAAAAYPFDLAGNATSTLTQFQGGITAFASTTIGNGTQGLTISGAATTTGTAYFAGAIGIGTSSPNAALHIASSAGSIDDGSPAQLLLDTPDDAAWQLVFRNDFAHAAGKLDFAFAADTSGGFQLANPNGNAALMTWTNTASGFGTTTIYGGLAIADHGGNPLLLVDGGASRVDIAHLFATGSSTIGDGTDAGGLTISGNATTTGRLSVLGTASLASLAGAAVSALSTNYIPKWNSASGIFGQSLVYDSGTQVGIGTNTNLSGALTAAGTFSVQAEGDVFRQYDSGDAAWYPIIARYNTGNGSYPASTYIFGNGTNARVGFEVPGGGDLTTFQVKSATSWFNGSVGIGITNPDEKLHVVGALKLTSNPTIANDNLATYMWNQAGVGPTIAGYQFEVRTNGDTPRLRIDGTGNVGIGTTDPQTNLDVVGNTYIRSTAGIVGSNDGVEIATDSSAPRVSLVQGGRYVGLFSGDAPGNTYLKNVAGGDLLLYGGSGGNVELARLTNGGNLGIGTSSPFAKLSVVGDAYIAGNLTATGTLAATGATISGGATTTGQAYFAGNVGIGTTGPSIPLDVQGSATVGIGYTNLSGHALMKVNGAVGSQSGYYIYKNGVEKAQIAVLANTNDLSFSMAGTDRLHVASGGNVGIGNTSPSYLLDVAGLGHFTGLVDAANFVATSSSIASLFNGGLVSYASSTIGNGTAAGGLTISGTGTTTNFAITGVTSSLLKTNALGQVSAAASGTDYAPATSGSSIQLGNGSGGFASYSGTSCTNQFIRSVNGAGVATCASVAIATDVSGLGTGVATFLATPSSANLISAVTDETGTGAAVFAASPTLTGTLTAANISLGSSGTGNKLFLYWNGITNAAGLTSNPSGDMQFFTGTGGTSTNMTIQASTGNVGIGTTTPATPLHVYLSGGGEMLRLETSSGSHQNYLSFFNGSTRSGYIGQGSADADINLYSFAGALNFYSNNGQRMVINSAGNIGIGTTSPSTMFSVAGNGYLTGGLGVGVLNTTAGTLQTTGNATFGGSVQLNSGSNWVNFNASSTDGNPTIEMFHVGVFDGTIKGTGSGFTFNTGIIAPSVVTTAGISGQTLTALDATDPYVRIWKQGNQWFNLDAGTNGQLNFQNTSNTNLMTLTSSGSLGIGNTGPSYKLDVAGFINTDQYSGYKQAGNTILYASSTKTSVALGIAAGAKFSSTAGDQSVAIGHGALGSASLAGAGYNTAVGYSTLSSNTTGDTNFAGGALALNANTTGSGNIGIGYQSFNANTAGNNNVGIGYRALFTSTSTSNQTAVGYGALQSNATGATNSAFGFQALTNNTYGNSNNAFGSSALANNSTATGNAAFGTSALYGNTTGNFNVGVGYQPLYSNTTGGNNIAIGTNALFYNTTGTSNVAVGYQSLFYNQSATNTVAIGQQAAQGSGTYSNQGGTYVGYSAGISAQTGSDYNTLVGYQSGYGITTGTLNTAVGASAGANLTTGSYNAVLGYNALGTATSTVSTTAFGYGALSNLRSSLNSAGNTAVGYGSLNANTYGGWNTALGYNSLSTNTTGIQNTALGYVALQGNTTGSNNIAVGMQTLASNTSGGQNIGVGVNALNTNTTGNYNVALGQSAGYSVTTGSSNALLGPAAGYNLTTGSNNVMMGNFSGTGGITTGSNNILIGQDVRYGLSQTTDNQLNIGNLIFANGIGSGTSLSTGNVGIGVSSPAYILDIAGSGAGASQANTIRLASGGWDTPKATTAALDGGVKLDYFDNLTNQKLQMGMNSGAQWWFSDTGASSGGFGFYTGTSNTIAPSARLTISAAGDTSITGNTTLTGNTYMMSGNVGIGTTTPGSILTLDTQNTTPAELTIASKYGSSYDTANVVLKSYAADNLRGMGTFFFNNGSGNEWFAGRPYDSGSITNDYFIIGHQSGLTDHNRSTSDIANSFFTMNGSGLLGIGTTNASQYQVAIGGGPGSALRLAVTKGADTSTFNRIMGFTDSGNSVQYGTFSASSDSLKLNANLTNLQLAGANNTIIQPTGGNVGIGTTSPAMTLDVQNQSAGANMRLVGATNYDNTFSMYNTVNQQLFSVVTSPTGARTDIASPVNGNSMRLYTNFGAINFSTNNGSSNNVTIDSSGNVGIGTTTPQDKLDVNGAIIARGQLSVSQTNAGVLQYGANETNIRSYGATAGTGYITFRVGGGGGGADTEVMRIGNTGTVGIGTSTPGANQLNIRFNGTGATTAGLAIDDSTSAGSGVVFVRFQEGAVTQGSITAGVSSVAYNTSSDRRLKENIATTTSGLSTLVQIPVRDFAFTSDPQHRLQQGFIAQELNQYYPYAVTTNGDNGTDALTGKSPWQVDYGRLTPLLVKSIQDLNTKVDANAATTSQVAAAAQQALDQFDAITGTLSASSSPAVAAYASAFWSAIEQHTIGWLGNAANGIHDLYASIIHANEVHARQLCAEKSDGTEVCVTGDQLAAALAAVSVSATPAPAPSSSAGSTSSSVDVIISGNNPATVNRGDSYVDLGATASTSDQAIMNLGVRVFQEGQEVTNVVIDTSVAGTSTIEYKIIDGSGAVLASATRTVVVEAPAPAEPVVSATSTPVAANAATSTTATSTTP